MAGDAFKRYVTLGLISAWLSWSATLPSSAQNAGPPPAAEGHKPQSIQEKLAAKHAPDRLVIRYKAGVADAAKDQVLQKVQGGRIKKIYLINADVVHLTKGKDVGQAITQAEADPNVEYAEPDYVVHTDLTLSNDPLGPNEWGLNNTGQSGGKVDADIDMPEAWALYKPTATVTVAVIDTGIDYIHPDLVNQVWVNKGEDLNADGKCTSADNNGKDDDGDGYVDDCRGWDFANIDNNPMDDNKHGTHVAGTINARVNNSIGVAGVAGKGSVKVMALKFMDSTGSGYTSDATKAVEYAIAKRAQIANNSWGGGGYSQALYDAMAKYQMAGGLFVVAAGNNATNNDTTATYPANYNLGNIISVASMTNLDGLSSFSNYGATKVHIGAPGSSIASTLPGNQYGYMSGTSMATPHVAGVAALLWTQRPTLKASQVKSILLSTARKVPSMTGKVSSGGMVNAQAALSAP